MASSEISYETLTSMTYLDQVLMETLRKYPIVPFPNGHPKYVIPKGTPLLIPNLGIQHNPEFYPSLEEFDPARFSPEMVKQRDSVEWLSFDDGPRNCIGMRFGKMRRFRFTVCPMTEIPLTFDLKPLVMSPINLLYLNVEAI